MSNKTTSAAATAANTLPESNPPSRGLPDRVAQLYYAHGLFCSTHPIPVLAIALTVILTFCYPLANVPLPGTVPQQYQSPRVNWTFDTGAGYTVSTNNNNNNEPFESSTSLPPPPPPRWFDSAPPFCYVQQVIVRTAVSPWESDLSLGDAFRAPLSTVFDLLQTIGDYQQPNATRSLAHVCLHVEGLRPGGSTILPEFGCLVLSPAVLWKRDRSLFAGDADLLGTVLSHQGLQKGRPTTAEMAFGMHMKVTGLKRYPVRVRQRILQYAVTLFLSEYDPAWISGLANRLSTLYPLHRGPIAAHGPWLHLYFPGELRLAELLPLAATYVCLFLYVYFSVRKIALVRSKVGMALSALIMCAASLAMSVGACFFFGLTLSPGTEIFPYLVVVVGLENILVLTKSVLATQTHLDAKIRVAQGLSREGWSITKNLLCEVTVLTLGLCTFVPAIQELCIFAVVGLISDFFLQMMFFAPVLALDVRSAAETDDAYLYDTNRGIRNGISMSGRVAHELNNYGRGGGTHDIGGGSTGRGLSRSRSSPRLSGSYQTANGTNSSNGDKIPKRLRLVQIWAKTRFFQRSFMIAMIMWIGAIAYNAGLVQSFLASPSTSSTISNTPTTPPTAEYLVVPNDQRTASISENSTNAEPKLRHWPWWPAPPAELIASILAQYNVTSLAGRYVTVLAPMRLAVAVPPSEARNQRHPREPGPSQSEFRWPALAAALDPLDIADAALVSSAGAVSPSDLNPAEYLNLEEHQARQPRAPYVPNSPMELFLSALLGLTSLGVVLYTLVALYRCICPRDYAEWRTSWWRSSSNNEDISHQVVMEAVPIVLEGHPQDIECLAADPVSPLIASSCLAGQVRVWDSISGQLVAAIDRKNLDSSRGADAWTCGEGGGGPLSDYESGSPPSRGDPGGNNTPTSNNIIWGSNGIPDLSPAIDTNFSGLRARTQIANESEKVSTDFNPFKANGFDFGPHIKQLFSDRDSHSIPMSSFTSYSTSVVDSVSTPPASPPLPASSQAPAIWAMDLHDGLLALGCSDGSVEFWDPTSGQFKCQFSDGFGEVGVTGVRVCGSRVAAARLSGALDLLRLDRAPPTACSMPPIPSQANQVVGVSSLSGPSLPPSGNTPALHRHSIRRGHGHLRTGSAGSAAGLINISDELRCSRITQVAAHQQPISVLEADGARGIFVTGSCDHTLRVWRLQDAQPLYTLHGHLGPVTALVVDRSPLAAASAAKDGSLCLWELQPQSGACVAVVQAHPTSILALASAPSYVVTLGAEQRLCVWERFQGHLLHAMQLWPGHGTPLCSSLAMLTPTLLVTSGPRDQSLAIWDVASGDPEPLRLVPFTVAGENTTSLSSDVSSTSPAALVLKQLVAATCHDAVVICDLGTQLRLVRIHSLADKQQ